MGCEVTLAKVTNNLTVLTLSSLDLPAQQGKEFIFLSATCVPSSSYDAASGMCGTCKDTHPTGKHSGKWTFIKHFPIHPNDWLQLLLPAQQGSVLLSTQQYRIAVYHTSLLVSEFLNSLKHSQSSQVGWHWATLQVQDQPGPYSESLTPKYK